MIRLFTDSIADKATKDALESLVDSLNNYPLLKGNWQFIEVTISGNTTVRYPHRLGFRPKDAYVISKTGAATVKFDYDAFTKDAVSITTSGGTSTTITTIRAFVGSYQEG